MQYPIRVLHVFGRLDRGGAETMIMNLYRSIDRNKIQFDFIKHTNDRCDYDEEIKNLGGRVYSIIRYNVLNHIEYLNSWLLFLKNHTEVNIIHGHIRSTASIYLKVAKELGLITIAHSHSTASRGNLFERIIKNVMQYPIRYIADYLVACSIDAGKWLFGNKSISKTNFSIIKNSIDFTEFEFNNIKREYMRKKLGLERQYVIGHIGSFTTPKNHNFIIKIFNEVKSSIPNASLLLVGDGCLKDSIIKKLNNLQLLDKVIFAGNVSNPSDYYQAMDVFVFPSLYEGFGMAAIEAQASGLYTLVSDKIPNEVFVTPYAKSLTINKSNYIIWANDIYKRYNDGDYIRNIKENKECFDIKDYDITNNSKILEDYYIKLLKR